MTGRVNADGEAIITVSIRGLAGPVVETDAVIDTGFTDYLTLPPDVVGDLQLPFREEARFTLADGSRVALDVYRAEVLWHGRWRAVLVTAAEGDPLVGMSLLNGSDLMIRVVEGGEVEILPIS